MSPKAAMMGANTKREGRSGGGALKAGSLAIGSDSAAKRERGETPPPARSPPPLRSPQRREPAPNEGGPLLDLSLIGCRLHHWLLRPRWCPHAYSLGAGSEPPPLLRSSSSGRSLFFCVAIIRLFVGRWCEVRLRLKASLLG